MLQIESEQTPVQAIEAYVAQVDEAAEYIRRRSGSSPLVGIICGTGMGALAQKVQSATTIL